MVGLATLGPVASEKCLNSQNSNSFFFVSLFFSLFFFFFFLFFFIFSLCGLGVDDPCADCCAIISDKLRLLLFFGSRAVKFAAQRKNFYGFQDKMTRKCAPRAANLHLFSQNLSGCFFCNCMPCTPCMALNWQNGSFNTLRPKGLFQTFLVYF